MRDTVKKDNRKSLPLFLLTVALAGLVGGVCGFFGAMAADKGMLDAVWGALEQGLRWIARWGIPVSALGLLLPAWLMLGAARRRFAAWDGESEEESEAIEGQLNQVLLRFHQDYCTLRRDMISEGILRREEGLYTRLV